MSFLHLRLRVPLTLFYFNSNKEIECGTAFIKKDTRRCHITLLDDSKRLPLFKNVSDISPHESESIALLQSKLRLFTFRKMHELDNQRYNLYLGR